jgi:KUP system potassium uptake protein
MRNQNLTSREPLSLAGLIMTIGIVFGGLGTSPLYVMPAILSLFNGEVNQDFMIGILSCLIWTLTLQTTIKYVFITTRADNKGEGGIMALYALIRKKKKSLFFVAILGGSALLADGVITPSITIVSVLEGMHVKFPNFPVIPLTLAVLAALFLTQKFGNAWIGKLYGPIMLLWFFMLTAIGLPFLLEMPSLLKSFNPLFAVRFLVNQPGALILMGAVFLVTTGAEALYSDLGHCGYKNLRFSWLFVKIALIINYMGQAAWVLTQDLPTDQVVNPFFAMMPVWFFPAGLFLSLTVAVIASRTLIRGFFTIISEAISLNFWPKLRINYPKTMTDQIYIPSVNWILFVACIVVVVVFQTSADMAAAYGLAITITMLMTTILMKAYLTINHRNRFLFVLFIGAFIAIEGSFLVINAVKFVNGAWFTILLTALLAYIMFIWYSARRIKNRFTRFVEIADYYEQFKDLSADHLVPKYSTNLVYLTRSDFISDVESKVIYSIFQKCPKRADTYWLLHVNICDDPYTMEYSVDQLIPGLLIRVEFRLGFKVQPRINLFFNEIIKELACENEISLQSGYPSLRKHDIAADFRFVIIHRVHNYDFEFRGMDQFILEHYAVLSRMAMSEIQNYGLDSGSVLTEVVPLVIPINGNHLLKRVHHPIK